MLWEGNSIDAGGFEMKRLFAGNICAPGHRPAGTTIEIVRLATDPRFILEVEAVAVIGE